MPFTIDGFDDLQNELTEFAEKAKKLDGDHDVSLDTLFSRSFMQKHTNHSDFGEFLSAGNFTVETQDDFDAIPEHELDAYVCKATNFSSWEEMQDAATEAYIEEQLGF